MTAPAPLPERERMEAVLMIPEGIGFAVGIGFLAAGRIERERSGHLTERDARAAAVALADRSDLLAFQCKG